MKGHFGVLPDMRQASAFRLREAVGEERCVSFIPEKGDGKWLGHSFFINSGKPDEWLVMQPTSHTLAGWRGRVGKLKRHIQLVDNPSGRWCGRVRRLSRHRSFLSCFVSPVYSSSISAAMY